MSRNPPISRDLQFTAVLTTALLHSAIQIQPTPHHPTSLRQGRTKAGSQVARATELCTAAPNIWVFSMDLGSCRPSSAYNFKANPTLLENFCTPALTSILILSSILRLVFSFLRVSPPKSYMHFFFYHTCCMLRSSHSHWYDHPNNIWRGIQIMKLLMTQFLPVSCYCLDLRPKYPQYHTAKHPKPIFFPQCKRPRFTRIQN